ncbi:MAG: hypothetical protein ACRD35_03890 [Candidatus Acidiferrales bacterium]
MRLRLLLLALFLLAAQPAWAAWTFVSARGTAQEKTSDGSLSVSPLATIAAGSILIVWAATDNPTNGTSCTDGTFHSVSDSAGNTYTLLRERTQGTTAAAGVTTSLWASKLATQLTTSSTVTVTISSNVTAKTVGLAEFTVAAGKTFSLNSSTQNCANGTDGSTTLSGLSASEHLHFDINGAETDVNPGTESGLTGVNSISTTGGGAASNINGRSYYKISSSTSETHTITWASANDHSVLHVAVDESSGVSPKRRRVMVSP